MSLEGTDAPVPRKRMSNISRRSSHVIGDVVLRLLLQLFVMLFTEVDLLEAVALELKVGLADLLDVEGSLRRLVAARHVADLLLLCVR